MLVLLALVLVFSSLFSVNVASQEKAYIAKKFPCCGVDWSSGLNSERRAIFWGKEVYIPDDVFLASSSKDGSRVLGVASTGERWIEVDLSEQKLRAWDGDQLFLETLVSTGLPWSPTPTGEFHIWTKFRATKMEGGQGKYYYYLPNVPFVMFFENSEVVGSKGYSLHGTYWHHDFGKPHSHGCVNLPTPIAEKLYYWTNPTLSEGSGSQRASADNPGTRIVIHN